MKKSILPLSLVILCLFGFFPAWGVETPEPQNAGVRAVAGDESAADAPAKIADKEPEPGMLKAFGNRIKQIWVSDQFSVFIPVYTWHNRLAYDQSKIRSYNENPWGGGLGKTLVDEDGDRHHVFLLGFQDSHDQFQPYGGYAYMKTWYLDEQKDFSVGAGLSLGITGRQEYDYIPLPLPLPIIGVQYKKLAVEAAYIPGTYNNGNVLFTWIRVEF